jgi:2-dehydropantoate 2-reductase
MPTRVLLVGAGAIGAFFGSRLATAPQVLVSALCRSNYKAVKANGFDVRSPQYGDYTFKPEYTFSSSEEAKMIKNEKGLTWDYLLVATKALPEVSDDSILLDGLVGEDTSIVLVQNGIGIEEPYRKRFPSTPLLSAVTIASCVQPKAGTIEHNRWTKISIGPFLPHLDTGGSGAKPSDDTANTRTSQLVEMLRSGGISDAETYDHAGLQFVRWHKIAINAAMNPSSVLTGGAGNQEMSQDPELARHAKGVMDEVLSAAPRIIGKEIPWKELKLATPEQVLRSVGKNNTGSRPSMYWDWVEGRKMELEAILGNPIRIARGEGIEMPRIQSMYAMLRKAQEKRDQAAGRSRL